MPSAQPETHGKRTETHACDLIGREAAIEALRDEFKRTPTNAIRAMDTIKNLPPAQPELIEKVVYIRGFEQGRTQGMIDSQGGKK